MADRYDAVVIGAGPAGEVCAGDLADGGMRVAIVERELLGGECTNWACIPSKTLLRPGEAIEEAREAPGAAEAVSGPLAVPRALEWRNFMVSDWDDSGAKTWLDDKGIELYRGSARLGGGGRRGVGGEGGRGGGERVAGGGGATGGARRRGGWGSRGGRIRSSRRSTASTSSTACGRTARPPVSRRCRG